MQRIRVDLPEPDGPQMTTLLAFLHVEVDVRQHVELSVPLVDALELDHRFDLRQIAGCCGHVLLPDGA